MKEVKFIELLKEGNESFSFRDVVDNLDEDDFENAAEAYHQAKLKLLNIGGVIGISTMISEIDKLKRFDESGWGEGGGTSREYCEDGENIDHDELQSIINNYR